MLIFTIFAVIIDYSANLAFIRDTLKGRSRPNLVTYGLWGTAPLIGFGIQISEGVGFSSIYTLAIALGPLSVFFTGLLVKHKWKLGTFDLLCGLCSIISLVLWLVLDLEVLAFLFSIISDLFAYLPTIRKLYIEPESETTASYVLAFIASIFAILAALSNPSIFTLLFPLEVFFSSMIGLILIYRKRIFRHIGVS